MQHYSEKSEIDLGESIWALILVKGHNNCNLSTKLSSAYRQNSRTLGNGLIIGK